MAYARGIRLWLVAWLASAALWMLLVDSVRIVELIAAAVVAAIAATGFEVVRRQRLASQAVRPDLTLRAWRVLPKVVPDVWRLTRAAVVQIWRREPVRGRVVAMPFGHTGDDGDDRAVRALSGAFGSIAPNSIVIGVDRDNGFLLVHQLEPTHEPSDLDPLRLR